MLLYSTLVIVWRPRMGRRHPLDVHLFIFMNSKHDKAWSMYYIITGNVSTCKPKSISRAGPKTVIRSHQLPINSITERRLHGLLHPAHQTMPRPRLPLNFSIHLDDFCFLSSYIRIFKYRQCVGYSVNLACGWTTSAWLTRRNGIQRL